MKSVGWMLLGIGLVWVAARAWPSVRSGPLSGVTQ